MKYGKIRIEDGYLIFTKHMIVNSLPCKDILWAYMRREGAEGGAQKQLIVNYLVIYTRRHKKYKFDMTEREVQDCIQLLKALNPETVVGFPKGGRIALQSLPNTRDLGALMSEDGRHILPRKLLRSGALYHVSQADQDMLLDEYQLSTVIDLRTQSEREKKPDTVMAGVRYLYIPVIEDDISVLSKKGTIPDIIQNFPDDPDEFMKKQYKNLIRDQYCLKQYAQFMDVLLQQEEGAVLWHCSEGKDRAGVASAVLLCALGIPLDVIREDFMRTNHYLDGEMEYMIRYLESKMIVDARAMDNIRTLYKVKKEYLDTVFLTILSDYGSIDRFLRRALYLTPKAIEDLRSKYLI